MTAVNKDAELHDLVMRSLEGFAAKYVHMHLTKAVFYAMHAEAQGIINGLEKRGEVPEGRFSVQVGELPECSGNVHVEVTDLWR